MRSFVTLLAAAAYLQGGSAAPFGNQQQPPTTISHSGFPHPTGRFPHPTGFLHPTGGPRRPDDKEHHWPGQPHPTGHHHHHPSGGFPHSTGRPESNIFLRRDADHVRPHPDGFAHPSGHHPHPTGGFPQPTGGPGHHHHLPGDNQDHGRRNWQGNHEKQDGGLHRPASISWPSGITNHLHPQPTTGVQPGRHVQQPDGGPKRERQILQEIPRVVQDAN
ncbi:hypothetical protein F4813DRAFT_400947 [Daldinia decipiens]|uniref:uncharacterized protein n=1 Tax=Daldinia decipiens TaxID=326647 RepID=UPI0020C374B3|nr:uncharacterized protein F4813DRAFT_400947 [Daldinia decipiens]KAI1652538.1 hypothetical protein F4813DRAFT_400947 [Daldinia decipiens]